MNQSGAEGRWLIKQLKTSLASFFPLLLPFTYRPFYLYTNPRSQVHITGFPDSGLDPAGSGISCSNERGSGSNV
uniref:Uncharacterized protein n=1 Tax=Utricularia reniformis TaxID=192314 RepID=A0A1Y0B3U7_9LAMI|nr:hypothetical protein AEK19_MT1900 [Utricularia reniformis]ART32068.1 hypothetical protein AEK19_MT1900 [Utricularia reniformis]